MPKQKPNNPRNITSKRLERLRVSLRKYGDISGNVENRRTGNWVGGNQRDKSFGKYQTEVVRTFDEPDEQGTVAVGWLVWEGKRYAYRQVDWPQEVEDAACIIANTNAGL